MLCRVLVCVVCSLLVCVTCTGITLPQDQPYKIKHPLRALQVKNRSTLAVPPFMSSMMSSTLHFSSSHPFRSSIPKVQEEAKTKPLTRTRRTLAKMMVDLVQCVYCICLYVLCIYLRAFCLLILITFQETGREGAGVSRGGL